MAGTRRMTAPDPSRIPFLLDGLRRQAEQLLQQTAEVEAWMAARHATHSEVNEHLYAEMCDCESVTPALCDKHATVMLMVGGPMDGHVRLHRLAGVPPQRWVFALPQPPSILPADPLRDMPRAEYVLDSYPRVGRGYGKPSRVWMYRCAHADDIEFEEAA